MSQQPALLDPNEPAVLVDAALAIADQTGTDWTGLLRSALAEEPARLQDASDRLSLLDRIVRGHIALRTATPVSTLRALPADVPQVRWGPLVVREKIGSGSFGLVYRAWDPRLDRDVALKVLSDDHQEPDAAIEEARAQARVHHPNVVTVHGAERVDGRIGIWMELVEGRSLAAEVEARGPFPPSEVARAGVDICNALAAVHASGLLHRDIKAQNVIRATSGRLVVGDFGTSIDLSSKREGDAPPVAGTPLYLAPELFTGTAASPASDLYSVGVLLHFLATGTFPVNGRTPAEIRQAHVGGRRRRLCNAKPAFPRRLCAIVDRLTDPDPSTRQASASDVAGELAEWVTADARPWSRRPAVVAGLLLAASAAIALTLIPAVRAVIARTREPELPAARLLGNVPCSSPVLTASVGDAPWIACAIAPPPESSPSVPTELILLNLTSGETRPIWRGPARQMRPLLSPDGRLIAAAFPTADSGGQPREVRLLDIESREWRRIWEAPSGTSGMSVGAWSSADDRLEVYLLKGDRAQLLLVSPSDGTEELVFEFPWLPSTWNRSADGRWLTIGGLADRELRVCDLRSGEPRRRDCAVVAPHPATDFLPFFAPDGSLLFNSDRGGTIGLWQVELNGLSPRGFPTQIRDLGRERLVPKGFTADAELFYALVSGDSDVLETSIGAPDASLVRSLAAPIRVSRTPAWSPDGEWIAYVSTLGSYTGTAKADLVIRPASGGSERVIALPEVRIRSARVAWSTTGRTLAVRAFRTEESRQTASVLVVDRDRGPTGTILRRDAPAEKTPDDQIGDIAWLDERRIVFARTGGVGVFDAITGSESAYWTASASERVANLALSSDRAWIAVTLLTGGTPVVRLLPAYPSTGTPPRLHPDATGFVQSWTADNAAVLVTRGDASAPSNRREVWRIPIDGSAPTPLGLAADGLFEVRAHPDGRRLALTVVGVREQFFLGIGR